MVNSAVAFTASDKAYLSIADASQTGLDPLTGDYSYSFWVNPTSLSSISVLINKYLGNTGYQLYVNAGSGVIDVIHSDGTIIYTSSSINAITTGSWQNFTVVANRTGNLYLYKNGNTASPIATLNISARTGNINNNSEFAVGANSNGYYLNGSMDSLGFWNRSLTTAEVGFLYNQGQGQKYAALSATEKINLVSWWDFDEGGGRRYDSHGTNHLDQVFSNIIDNASTLGTELVTNGTFDSDTTGWTATNATLASVAGGQSGNCLEMANSGTNYGYAYQAITTVANQNYTLSIYFKKGTSAGGYFYIGSNVGLGDIFLSTLKTDSSWTQYTLNFKAVGTTTYLHLQNGSTTNGQTSLFDTISVKALTATNLNGGFELQGSGETLGSELCLNPGFETAGGGGADVFANWSETPQDGTIADETTLIKSGSHAVKITCGATTTYPMAREVQQISVTAGNRYKLTFWTRGDGANAGRFGVLSGGTWIYQNETTGVTGTTYTQVTKYFTVPAGETSVFVILSAGAVNGAIAYFDDVSLKQVTAYAPFLNWGITTLGSNTITADSSSPNSGTYDALLTTDSAGSLGIIYATGLAPFGKYKATLYSKTNSGTSTFFSGATSGGAGATIIATTTWAQSTYYFTNNSSTWYLLYSAGLVSKSIYIDDVTLICTEIPATAGLAIDGNLCASFNGTTQGLSVASNASLQTGDIDFTVFGWFNLSSKTSTSAAPAIVGKWDDPSGQREFNLTFDSTATYPTFWISPDGSTNYSVVASTVAVAPNTWYFFEAYHDSVNNKIGLNINNGTPVEAAHTTGLTKLTGPFNIGVYNAALNAIPERIDGVGFIKRILTASERTAIFNNGKGVKYAGLPASIRNDSLLTGFWNLDAYSDGTTNVTRMDSTINANHLTATGNPPSAVGVANSSDYPTTVCGEPSFIY